jgi:hypothetical protein
MNPIGDVKGFMLDVMKNIAIIFGIGYMGGSLVALTHLDKLKLDKILPIDLKQSPYVGEKGGFTFTGYGFPYNLYTKHADFFPKVMNWLIMTCAFVFVGIRSLFRWIASLNTSKLLIDMPLFYLAPLALITIFIYSRTISSTLVFLIALFSIFFGEYVLEKEQLKNGLWYWLAPLSFFYAIFVNPIEPGIFPLIIRCFVSFLAFLFGWFSILVLYPLWWSGTLLSAMIYYILFLFFSPIWYGFEKVIAEMSNHRISLTFIFMALTILSANTYLTKTVTIGITVGSIYMFYLLLKYNCNK